MSHKLLDLYPKISSQSEKNLDLSKFTALALPVIPGDKVDLVKSKLLKEITEVTKLNLNIELANWPDFTAKPGEKIVFTRCVCACFQSILRTYQKSTNYQYRKKHQRSIWIYQRNYRTYQ